MLTSLLIRYLRWANRAALSFPDICEPATLPCPIPDRRYLLYVHIPYCEVLCPFCTFHRVEFRKTKALHYYRALRREIRLYHETGFDFAEVYVGGGTPTVVPEELGETLHLIRSLFSVGDISVETNPDHLRPSVLTMLKEAGVNRLSVGVQSFDDRLLKEMDRYAKYGSGAQIIGRLQDTKGIFDTVNADLLFNLPHQTRQSLINDVEIVTNDLQLDQVSYYPLMPAKSTMKKMSRQMGQVTFTNERQYYYLIHDMISRTYQPSSAWCFSRDAGMIDEYIVDYDQYVGVGSGSFGYLDGTIHANSFSISQYIDRVNRGLTGITRSKTFTRQEQLRYFLMTSLFGLSLSKRRAEKLFGPSFFHELHWELRALRWLGAIKDRGEQLVLTRRGMYYWVMLMREFLMGVNNFRDEMRGNIRIERTAQRELAASLNAGSERRP